MQWCLMFHPIFPIAEAKGGGSEDDPLELKVYDLKEVPFPVGGGGPAPSTPSKVKECVYHCRAYFEV